LAGDPLKESTPMQALCQQCANLFFHLSDVNGKVYLLSLDRVGCVTVGLTKQVFVDQSSLEADIAYEWGHAIVGQQVEYLRAGFTKHKVYTAGPMRADDQPCRVKKFRFVGH